MSTIYVRLVGGLGNQLYQVAFSMLLARKLMSASIQLDTSGMNKYNEVWGFLLPEILDINAMPVRCSMKNNHFLKYRLPKFMRNFPEACHKFGLVSDGNGLDAVKRLPNTLNEKIFVDGYFEFESLVPEYVELISPLLKPCVKIQSPEDILVVNVRGGEFARLGLTSLGDRDNYQKAIDNIMLNRHISEIHLVTDDVMFSKELLEGVCKIDQIHTPDPINNFRMLVSAKNKILSRSTFAKWAGFLSSRETNIEWL